ncbi:MAG TPA: ATP-binding protein [Streptosporangiaceae bacterium]|nr:ATP-binding protein [Streptosporangiaceae bacterium]
MGTGGGGYCRFVPSWAQVFPGTPGQVRTARRFVAGLLKGSPLLDDAMVVLSELFTNALCHTVSGRPGGLVTVQVSRWRLGVRIAVTDQGSISEPAIRHPAGCGEPIENGHGLYLAASLASRLGWHDDARGRTVVAVLGELPPGHSGRSPQCVGDEARSGVPRAGGRGR